MILEVIGGRGTLPLRGDESCAQAVGGKRVNYVSVVYECAELKENKGVREAHSS